MKKRLIVILFCLLIAFGGIYMAFPYLSGLKYRNDKLESCRVSTGGGMLGGYTELCLKQSEDGATVLVVREKETHADRERTSIYKASPEDLDTVHKLVRDHDLAAASRRRRSRIQVLDGDTTTFSFEYSKGDFSVSSYQVLSSKMEKGCLEVMQFLSSLAKGECETFLEPQEARLHLKSGYNLFYLVEESFENKLDGLLGEEREVSRYRECGIILAPGEELDLSDAEPFRGTASAGMMIYDSESGSVMLLYNDCDFEKDVYLLAQLDGHVPSAAPLIEEMTGPYSLIFN